MDWSYKPLEPLSDIEISRILETGDTNELIRLPLSVGEFHPDWKFAQDLCVKLSNHEDGRVRANSVLGLAYIARSKHRLQKHIVEPILLKELIENTEYNWTIMDAIDDINILMKWNVGRKY